MAQKNSSNSSSNGSNSCNTPSDGNNRSRSNINHRTGGGATPQLLLIELKQRIIAALNKLSDRDTQHIAIEELERIAESLSPEGISLCLSCLYETDLQQKSTVRKECVKMFGTLASLHEELLSPHLPKIVNNIVKRLRDPDSSIRDACAEAMGTLAAKVSPPSSSNGGAEANGNAFTGALGVFAKPLFDVLNEQSRGVQVGAAMCLSEVIDNMKDPSPGALQRLCPRVIKLLNSSTFTAKAALLSVLASIVQAGGATSYQSLAMVMACIQECLKSNDWATRKSASETLASIASATNCPSLSTFKPSVIESLESCRFDKVKPVRDVVIQTLQVWKRFPDSDSGVDKPSSIKDSSCNEGQNNVIVKRKIEAKDQNHSDHEVPDFGCFGFTHTRSGANKIHGDSQKKRAPLTDKRGSAPFFGKTEKKDNWQIDISIPRLGGGNQDGMETPKQVKEKKGFQERFTLGRIVDHLELLETSNNRQSGEASEKGNSHHISSDSQGFKESICMSSTKSRSSVTKQSSCVVDSSSQLEEVDMGSWSVGPGTVDSSSSSIVESQSSISENDSAYIKRQLCHIENQQSSILELLQKFMNQSSESLLKLEARISGVESTMAHLIMDLTNGRHEGESGRCVNKVHTTLDDGGSRTFKRTEMLCYSQERPISSEGIRSGRKSPVRSPRIGTNIIGFGEMRFGASTIAASPTGNVFSETLSNNNSRRVQLDMSSEVLQRRARNEGENNSFLAKGILERSPVSSRLGNGEGPSARSIWQASKDEATLAAIRVAGGEDGRLKTPENLKAIALERTHSNSEMKQEAMRHKPVVGGQGKGPFWSLWARAAEFLRSGDIDSAYVEVLCAGDELLLVRLMSRTGPVIEQLSNGTAQELLGTIIVLMLHQSFLDVVVPWLQQVVDLVTSKGSDCLGFSPERKRELMDALGEASTSNYSEKWIATSLHEISIQLGTTWGLV